MRLSNTSSQEESSLLMAPGFRTALRLIFRHGREKKVGAVVDMKN